MVPTLGSRVYSESEWEIAKSVGRRYLIDNAASIGQTVVYSQFAHWVESHSAVTFPGDHFDGVGDLLGDISRDERRAGLPLLSALVVYSSGQHKGTPGPGFYNLLEEFDIDEPHTTKTWRELRDEVWAHWEGTSTIFLNPLPIGLVLSPDYEVHRQGGVTQSARAEGAIGGCVRRV